MVKLDKATYLPELGNIMYRWFLSFSFLTIVFPVYGESFFINLPQFVGAETTFETTGFPNPTYFYYFKIPAGIGKGIKTIEILQEEGGKAIDYNLERIAIKGETNILFTVGLEPRKLIIKFNEPIEQSQAITIAISPFRNPYFAGIYQFRVTAFPDGDRPRGQYLGYARFSFDRPWH